MREEIPKSFYDRYAWKRLRYTILQKHGPKCMLCNATREDGAVIQVDHIKPISIWPELALTESNLQVLCRDCNLGKSNKDITDFRVKRAEAATQFIEKRIELTKKERRERAYARISAAIKRKLIECEKTGDQVGQAKYMRMYLRIQRRSLKFRDLHCEGSA